MVVAWLGSALAALGLDAWMRPRVGKAASLLGVAIFFTCGPAIILQLPYAESLGLALVAIGFAVLAKRRFAWAMVVFVLAAFTRPIGVPLGAALGLWWVWEELRALGLISTSRFDASFSSARVYADADPYAANYDAASYAASTAYSDDAPSDTPTFDAATAAGGTTNTAPVPNEAAIASFETAPDLTASASFEAAPQAIPAPPNEAGAVSPSESGAVGTKTTGSAHAGPQAGDSETSGPEASESATSAIASFEAAPIAASAEASPDYDVVANYEAATASNAPAPAPAPPALPSFTPMDLSPMPLSSKDRLWLFVTAAVTCAAALTWPLLAWIATGRMSAYVDTETAWRGVDLAPFEAWINRSASFGGAHAGVIGLFGVLVELASAASVRAADLDVVRMLLGLPADLLRPFLLSFSHVADGCPTGLGCGSKAN